MKIFSHYESYLQPALLVAVIVALVLAGYVAYEYRVLDKDLRSVKGDNLELAVELGTAKVENLNLLELTKYQQSIIGSFNGQIQDISSTVGTLEKLSQTDKELLRKYSKIYFLSENYVPGTLTQVEVTYVFDENSPNLLIHTQVWPYLKKLMDAARPRGLELLVVSAFRSFDTQASLKSEYQVIYGIGTANQFSADQGYSEHQLGTSVDFTTPEAGAALTKFQTSDAYQWLKDNAHKYGFVLSYPEGNVYYKFEPWHWRFVGVALSERLHADGKYFYDLDQREIDTYLVKLFD